MDMENKRKKRGIMKFYCTKCKKKVNAKPLTILEIIKRGIRKFYEPDIEAIVRGRGIEYVPIYTEQKAKSLKGFFVLAECPKCGTELYRRLPKGFFKGKIGKKSRR